MNYNIYSKDFEINRKEIVYIFDAITNVCEKLNIPFFVVGAFARDIIMAHIHNFSSLRKTGDIDIAIMVASWNTYEKVKQALIIEYNFTQGNVTQKLIINNYLEIDIIPFGDIEENNTISWPPHFHFMMNTIGYQEIYQSAIPVFLDKKYKLLIASLEGLVLLKLIAWNDRKYQSKNRKKHIEDILFIIDHYFIINIEEMVIKYPDLFDVEDIDDIIIATEALGRNLSTIIYNVPKLKDTVLDIIKTNLQDKENSLFIEDLKSISNFEYSHCIKILKTFHKGINYTPIT